jgi:hypothetical protein
VSPVEWAGEPPQPPAEAPKWPTQLSGYAKLIATAITTVGATGVLQWLQAAGVTSLPPWATAGITALVGLLTVLFGPRNRP